MKKAHIGIHFNLTHGKPLTNHILLCSRLSNNGRFGRYLLTRNSYIKPLSKDEKRAIYEELSAQVKKMQAEGIIISHADSHQHVHNNWQVAPIILQVCKDNKIGKIRIFKNVVNKGTIKNGLIFVYNEWLKRNGFATTDYFGNMCEFEDLADGITEIMVHPSFDEKGNLVNHISTMGDYICDEKLEKVRSLCNNCKLISYEDL